MILFQLNGPLRITGPEGEDLRPRLSKSRALLAVLALIPGHRHTRSWFQNLLWEDRQHEQGLSSLRSALSDIRRHLGPFSDAVTADHAEIALDPQYFQILEQNPEDAIVPVLEGFDIPNASNFEDWMREVRSRHNAEYSPARLALTSAPSPNPTSRYKPPSFFLGCLNSSQNSLTTMTTDMLIDGIAKSLEDLGLADVVDGRGYAQAPAQIFKDAQVAGCDHVILSQTGEAGGQSMARIKCVEIGAGSLVWSKSITNVGALEFDSLAISGVVSEFIEVVSDRFLRGLKFEVDELPPSLIQAMGINYLFKLGAQNFETSDQLLSKAYALDPRGRYLAWRAYLRTIMLGEQKYVDRDSLIEEGVAFAQRALEDEPYNSMVLALCAQVEVMLTSHYAKAHDLASRALELNRFNPLAWSMLGTANAFMGDTEIGHQHAQKGAQLAQGSKMSFKLESCAGSTAILEGGLAQAKSHAQRANTKSPMFAPPLRYLSAIYCHEGKYDLAEETAAKLQLREPGFSLDRLRDDGYPSESIRKAGLLKTLPGRQV